MNLGVGREDAFGETLDHGFREVVVLRLLVTRFWMCCYAGNLLRRHSLIPSVPLLLARLRGHFGRLRYHRRKLWTLASALSWWHGYDGYRGLN